MLTNEHLVPNPHLLLGLYQNQLQTVYLAYYTRHPLWQWYTIPETTWSDRTAFRLWCWQDQITLLLQGAQHLQAPTALRQSPRIAEPELPTQSIRQLCSVHLGIAVNQPVDMLDYNRLTKLCLDLPSCYHHIDTVFDAAPFVQLYLWV